MTYPRASKPSRSSCRVDEKRKVGVTLLRFHFPLFFRRRRVDSSRFAVYLYRNCFGRHCVLLIFFGWGFADRLNTGFILYTVQSSACKPGTRLKSLRFLVRTIASWASAMAAIFKSIAPMRRRSSRRCSNAAQRVY